MTLQPSAIHLKPAAELAERVLLPGDPHRALAVAQAPARAAPKMFNHTRGLWGYTGIAADGEPLTVQATGMGGPSAAIVCEELIALGARRLVRIGTCGALDAELELGDLVAAERGAVRRRRERGARRRTARSAPTPSCSSGWSPPARGRRPWSTSDLFYDPRDGDAGDVARARRVVVEMEAATILQVAARRGVAAGCVLGVTDVPGDRMAAQRVDPDELTQLGVRGVGEAGYAASGALGDRQALLRTRHGLPARGDRLAQRGEVARDLVEPPLDAARRVGSWRRAATASRSSSRSIASSMPSRRCDTERSRRVTRSMSAAEGRLSAPMAASCACTAFSRASKARAIAPFTTGFEISSSAILPRASSPCLGEAVDEALIAALGRPSRAG